MGFRPRWAAPVIFFFGRHLRDSATFHGQAVFFRYQPIPTMKTALTSLLTASLLGFASLTSGRPFDAADFVAILFATGLAAWTIEQYSRQPRVLTLARPIRLPLNLGIRHSQAPATRLAA
jgi:hypothetical protein